MTAPSGHECNFISEPDDSFKCLICLAVARDPWQHGNGKCGRLFCEKCLNKHGKDKPCPNCRMEQPLYFEDCKSKREVIAFHVKCDNVERGCDWEGTVGTLEKHLDSCNITPIPCPKKCKHNDMIRTVMRKDLERHLAEDCMNRDYECTHCKKKDTFANITEIHDNLCGKKIVPCPNIGCTENMERAKLKKHVNKCGYTIVSCKHTHTGCDKKLRRKDMKAHEQDYKAQLHQPLNTMAKLQHELKSASKDMEPAMKTRASMDKTNKDNAIKLKSATKVKKSLKKENESELWLLNQLADANSHLTGYDRKKWKTPRFKVNRRGRLNYHHGGGVNQVLSCMCIGFLLVSPSIILISGLCLK